MKKYMAFGLTLSGVHSVGERVSGLVKPEVEKFGTSVAFAGEPLGERKNLQLVLATVYRTFCLAARSPALPAGGLGEVGPPSPTSTVWCIISRKSN